MICKLGIKRSFWLAYNKVLTTFTRCPVRLMFLQVVISCIVLPVFATFSALEDTYHSTHSPYELDHWVSDVFNEVPQHAAAIYHRLLEDKACSENLFGIERDKTEVEAKYEKFIREGHMEPFKNYEQVADMMVTMLHNLPHYLISHEMMDDLDMILTQGCRVVILRSLRRKRLFVGCECFVLGLWDRLLRSCLSKRHRIFSQELRVQRLHRRWLLAVSKGVTRYIAPPYHQCGWLQDCPSFSRDMLFLRLLQLPWHVIEAMFQHPTGEFPHDLGLRTFENEERR
ncbi:hypothetical protein RF11_08942 [Thelohanellus kitauei]|uniref:Uncharacterized protein n=1 Tax=Thelohanellus kitauei TaxID=669202 RepID=A0A0C2MMA6_THEKT|nr:hypothetical protein RF11_08942 [Thelohanellus kitauei]